MNKYAWTIDKDIIENGTKIEYMENEKKNGRRYNV